MNKSRCAFLWGRKTLVNCFRSGWVWIMLVSLLLSIRVNASDTLNLSVMIAKGTCEFVLPPKVELGSVASSSFLENGGTASIAQFSIGLKKCTGSPSASEKAGIVFKGRTLLGDPTEIFNDDANGKAGFMFKEGTYSGNLANFKNSAGTVLKDSPSSMLKAGTVPEDGTSVPYTVGFVALDKVTPSQGDVTSSISFEISYN